jgi:hypothetical protein
MKVKFIKNDTEIGLTIDKIYDVIKINNGIKMDLDPDGTILYVIENDYGIKLHYLSTWFKTISEIREEKLNRLLNL